jgi:hypothetical protein
MTTTAETLRQYIADKQAKIDDLIKTHGQGVRPGWVGEEIAMLMHYQRDAERQLAALENDNGN